MATRQSMRFGILHYPADDTFSLLKITVDRMSITSRKPIPKGAVVVHEFTAARFGEGRHHFNGFVEGLMYSRKTGVT